MKKLYTTAKNAEELAKITADLENKKIKYSLEIKDYEYGLSQADNKYNVYIFSDFSNDKQYILLKKIIIILKSMIWIVFGFSAGDSYCKYIFWLNHPEVYMAQSAPWWYTIIANFVFSLISIIVLCGLIFIVKRIQKTNNK